VDHCDKGFILPPESTAEYWCCCCCCWYDVVTRCRHLCDYAIVCRTRLNWL